MATYAIYREPAAGVGPDVYRNTMVFAQDDAGGVAVRAIDGAKEAEWQRRFAGGTLTYFDGGSWGMRQVAISDPDFFHVLAVLLRYGKAHLGRPCPLDGVDAEAAVDDVFKHQIAPGHYWQVRRDGEAVRLALSDLGDTVHSQGRVVARPSIFTPPYISDIRNAIECKEYYTGIARIGYLLLLTA